VSLNSTGAVKVFATEINNNSTDNCGIVTREISTNGVFFTNCVTYTCANVGMNVATLRVKDAGWKLQHLHSAGDRPGRHTADRRLHEHHGAVGFQWQRFNHRISD
jgi:hypothetical protein